MTSIAQIDPPVDLAMIAIRPLMIHVVPFMVEAGPAMDRLSAPAAKAPLPLMHSMARTLPGKAGWFATRESAGAPTFDDVEEMAEAAGLLAIPHCSKPRAAIILRKTPCATANGDNFQGPSKFRNNFNGLRHCCIFATFAWTWPN